MTTSIERNPSSVYLELSSICNMASAAVMEGKPLALGTIFVYRARNVLHAVPCGLMRTHTLRQHFGHQPTYAVPVRFTYTRL